MSEGMTMKELNEERTVNLTEAVVTAWLKSQGFAPLSPTFQALDSAVVRSTDNICDDLADICDLDPNDVAEVMLKLGYSLTFPRTGRHGWVLCRPK